MGFVQLLAVDTANVYARNAYKLKELSRSDGAPSGGLYGSIRTINAAIKRFDPDEVLLACEDAENFRKRLNPAYKADRVQREIWDDDQARALIMWAGLSGHTVGVGPQHEADDVIATQVAHTHGTHVIMSSDHDMNRLLVEGQVWILKKDAKSPLYSESDLLREHGVTPWQYDKVAWLTGDASDNVQGIKGIGPKKALKAWEKHEWNLDSLLKDEKFAGYRDLILHNQRVLGLVYDCEPLLERSEPNDELLKKFYEMWELRSLRDGLE